MKDIPLLGTLVKVYSIRTTVTDALYLNKLRAFLFELDRVDQKRRDEFVESLAKNPDAQAKFGVSVLELIDKADNAEKAQFLGKLMSAYISGEINPDRIFRLCHMVNRAFVEDLPSLRKFEQGLPKDAEVAESLAAAGFISPDGLDAGRIDEPDSGGTLYRMNSFGEEFVKHGLS